MSQECKKRVTLDMTPGLSHVHKVRTVVNSLYSHKDFVVLSGWSKAYTKQKFESAMAIFKVRDHRSYAQVLLSNHHNGHNSGTGRTTAHHTALQGDQNAIKQLVVNTDSNTSKVKGSIVSTNKQKYHNVGKSNIEKHAWAVSSKADSNPANKQIQASTIQVSECYPIAISNRFQVLDNNQDVQVDTSGEVDSQSVDSHTYEQQLQADPSIRQTIVEPDPNMTIADLSAVLEYQKCKEQIGTKFGCVPLAPIYVYTGPTRYWDSIPDILTAHKLIRQSGLPNFLGLRIPVRTNFSSWRHHLVDYFDQQLLDLIEFEFPLDFDRSRDLQSTFVNHASARLYPDKYIEEEVGF